MNTLNIFSNAFKLTFLAVVFLLCFTFSVGITTVLAGMHSGPSGAEPGSQNADGSGANSMGPCGNVTGTEGDPSNGPGGPGGPGGSCTPANDPIFLSCMFLGRGGGSNCPTPCPAASPAPVVTLTANPTKVNSGSVSTLTWTATDATSCTATGGWSGAKSPTASSEAVTVVANTTYSLSCTGSGGTTNEFVTVSVPSGSLNATSCIIPAGNLSCPSAVTWQSADFLGTTDVLQGTTSFSTSQNNLVGSPREITPDDRTFTLRDTVGTFSITHVASVICDSLSVWAGGSCIRLPIIMIKAEPNVIRTGSKAPIKVEIIANYDMSCTLKGGINQAFTHNASASSKEYNYDSNPLTSGQIVSVDCYNIAYPIITGHKETKVEVTPSVEEI